MKTRFLTYCLGLMAMVLAACTSDEVEMKMQDAQTFVYAMDLDGGKFDFDATRAAKSWESGDKIYIRFGKTNKGTATYNGSTWSLTTDQALEGSGSCTAVEIDGTVAENGSTVTMSGLNPVYQCNSGSFSLSGNVIKVSIKMTPATGRLRFKGTSGASVNLEGLSTYSAYNTATGEFTSTTATVSTTIKTDGYTPYIYGKFANASEPTLKTNGYVMKCPTTMLQVGKSGWLTYPTDSKHTGWTKDNSNHEYVDLGLPSGTLWATCNVGANVPEEAGDYYSWGETETKNEYIYATYKWCNGTDRSLTKYCTSSEYGTVDNKTRLDIEDDAARSKWGSCWRIPTNAELTELIEHCTWVWTTTNGINGYKVTGSNGKSIFLPAAGNRVRQELLSMGRDGGYWSSDLSDRYANCAYALYFDSTKKPEIAYGWSKNNGSSIRPVYDNRTLENGHEYVDLGLSVKWATCNVGANAPQDYGWYLAWGETKPKDKYIWDDNYFDADLSNNKYTKEGATLAPEDDAAHVNWGGSWRMPTKAECYELKTSTNLKWTTLNGVKGFTLTSRINGNSIFLPAAGYREDNEDWGGEPGKAIDVGIFCLYWSNTLTESYYMASILEYCSENYIKGGEEFRSRGLSVRPVCHKTSTR